MNFVKFTEHNDHEGESWCFWLQKDDNDNELAKLQKLLGEYDTYEETYKLQNMGAVDEHDVDVLVKHSGEGYMSYHNKVSGKFTCPQPTEEEKKDGYGWLNDTFYKGEIREYFK
jgi:hypothetical protein